MDLINHQTEGRRSASAKGTGYRQLEARFRKVSRLGELWSIVAWDEAVMMPAGAGEARGAAVGELGGIVQNLICDPIVGEWLQEAEENQAQLSPWQRANLVEMRRQYLENTAIPVELNQRLTVARMQAEQLWRKLRTENNWKDFQPKLQEVLSLTRETLQALGQRVNLPIYDTALMRNAKGLTTKIVEDTFLDLKKFLPSMVQTVIEKQRSEPVEIPRGRFPMAIQKSLGLELMKALGFDFEHGRLDESHHPFCGGNPHDVRITSRYSETEFLSSLMGVLHETGHALYEQNLPREWVDQPVGGACGMAVHESQSLTMEMQVVRSREFIEFAAPLIRQAFTEFTENPSSLETENLIRLVTRVKPGLIRTEADEVTYPAHVILRFEIERDLMEDRWSLAELPDVWNTKMKEYLGLSTEGDFKNGCMQDVHWPSGAWGYFPAYTFGAVIAAQLFARAETSHPGLRSHIRQGHFSGLKDWLKQNIWSQGSLVNTLELVNKAAGPLTTEAFHRHLKNRYL